MRRRLTERIIESLRTEKAQEDVFHIPTPSAGLRLTRDGRKTWFTLYRSPAFADAKGEPKIRRYYFGEHCSGNDLFCEMARKSPQMVRQVKKVLSGVYEYCRANYFEEAVNLPTQRRFPRHHWRIAVNRAPPSNSRNCCDREVALLCEPGEENSGGFRAQPPLSGVSGASPTPQAN